MIFFPLMISQLALAQSERSLPREPQTQIADQLLSAGMQMEQTAFDCSHFVNYLFEQAGLNYKYEPSRILYRGTDDFRRVPHPAAGDLIVWPGHVGIVVDPEAKTFLSALRRGVRVASYTSSYWRRRGHARFFRHSALINEAPLWEAGNGSSRTLNDYGLE